ncbi:MAG: NAD(P)H-hydrate dehydratase [Enterobacterales bacterium]|nr:NAD(P)H-hydrate dehydratase [Enterobacterales bacterium]
MIRFPLQPAVALYTADQIKQIEKAYAAEVSDGMFQLMKRAGSAVFKLISMQWPEARRILILAGKGNNAGDGFVVAKLAAEKRLKVTLCCIEAEQCLEGDAKRAYEQMPQRVIDPVDVSQLNYQKYDLIVDAMLGTGLKGGPKGAYLSCINSANASGLPILSIDIPTGLEADTGFVYSDAIKAAHTVTFVGYKKGLYTGAAANFRGQVKLAKLDIPDKYFDQGPFHLFSQNWHSIKHRLKPRPVACHKGMFGHTIVIGGNQGMSGAAILASRASARSGSGLTSAWVAADCAASIVNHTPEVMAKGIALNQIDGMVKRLEKQATTFVIGPGLGMDDWSQAWIDSLSKSAATRQCAQVWDADGLNLLAKMDSADINYHNHHRILTPHPAEAARLLRTSTYSIEQDRFAAAQAIVDLFGGVCVLKGNGTIIVDQKGFQAVCPVGNPGMAAGGMGDVLAGIIGALLSQGHSLMDAAVLGVCIHGEAADRAAGPKGYYRGLMASDLFSHFSRLLNPS